MKYTEKYLLSAPFMKQLVKQDWPHHSPDVGTRRHHTKSTKEQYQGIHTVY